MKCECGKIISRYMKGKCMACRYKEKLGGGMESAIENSD
jgi:hypothetical protein